MNNDNNDLYIWVYGQEITQNYLPASSEALG